MYASSWRQACILQLSPYFLRATTYPFCCQAPLSLCLHWAFCLSRVFLSDNPLDTPALLWGDRSEWTLGVGLDLGSVASTLPIGRINFSKDSFGCWSRSWQRCDQSHARWVCYSWLFETVWFPRGILSGVNVRRLSLQPFILLKVVQHSRHTAKSTHHLQHTRLTTHTQIATKSAVFFFKAQK